MIAFLAGLTVWKWNSLIRPVVALWVLVGAPPVQTAPLRQSHAARRPAPLAQALARSGANRAELEKALKDAPSAQKEGLRFLVENMPDVDLETLGSSYLLENAALAYAAFDQAPWKARIPKRLFLNDVLPYACLTEKRDGMRKFLRDVAAPLVEGCDTPAEAAYRLNQQLFKRLDAHYSTAGTRPDQCVSETLASGKATCIGLSVLLVGACRAVGIPARLAGIPLWPDSRGTHEWVEIWDGGWHFMGADEPYSEGLDHAWFNQDATKAIKAQPMHAIYATSFEKTGTCFPLIWAPDVRWISAVNVTDRYRSAWPLDAEKRGRLIVQVFDRRGRRLPATITVKPIEGANSFTGMTPGPAAKSAADLAFPIPRILPAARYVIQAEFNGSLKVLEIKAGAAPEDVAVFRFP